MATEQKISEVEVIKLKSNYLRGTIKESLIDEITGAIAPDDTQLIKFHGSYQQADRDLESERKKQKLEPLYSFMIRARIAAGIVKPEQWQVINNLADKYGNGTIKLTTRQTFQLHGILKGDLKKTIQKINEILLDTIAACGDVSRNVISSSNPEISTVHGQMANDAAALSNHLLPNAKAYHEIWLDKKLVADSKEDEEPLYGSTYLPRKFKIAFAIPPNNDTDLFTNDLGFIAITNKEKIIGYNLAIGGGMGMTYGVEGTYPRLASVIGYLPREKLFEVAEKVLIIQRDNGDRSDRKKARLKYTIDRLGLDWIREELNNKLGWKLEPARDFLFSKTGDEFGWRKIENDKWHLTLFIEGGRILDRKGMSLKSALNEIAKIHTGEFRMTGNQNLIVANIIEKDRDKIVSILKKNGVKLPDNYSGLRLNSIACVALNTCSLAFAEAERYLPSLIDKLEVVLQNLKLNDEAITIRMTGCPNGCARPYNAEIGFVGRAKGLYNLYLGGGFTGKRLNTLYKEMVDEKQILDILTPILTDYSKEKKTNERFGDFVHRKGIVQ